MAGCAVVPNPYEKYYSDKTGGPEIARASGVKVFSEPPRLLQGTDPNADFQAMVGEGYAMLGYSAFNGKEFPTDLALEQARKIGATRVIVYHKYTETEHGATAVSVPTFGTAITRTPSLGTISSTAVGSTTAVVPTSMRRYEQSASYWAPIPPGVLGVSARDLNPEERAKLQSNKGVRVIGVVKRSPAFQADILKDDIIKTVAGSEVDDLQGFRAQLKAHAGQRVVLTIIRGDQAISKSVQLSLPGS